MNVRELTPALQKKAEKEINENPQRVAADLATFRDWLEKQPHLKSVRPTDQWLLAFLRGGKFNLERSKQKLEMYYSLRPVVPEYFGNRDPYSDEIQELLKLGVFLPLRKCREEDSPRLCLSRIGLLDPSKHRLVDMIKLCFMIIEILLLEDDNFTVAGEEAVVDMKNIKFSILSQWTPALAKKTVSCFEKAIPLRLKASYIINTSPGFEVAYKILKAFLGEKLKKRFQVFGKNNKDLFKVAPRDILPIEYGGEEGNIEELRDHWKAKVESYRDWFMDGGKTNESKQLEVPKTSAINIGIEHSFRNLEVD